MMTVIEKRQWVKVARAMIRDGKVPSEVYEAITEGSTTRPHIVEVTYVFREAFLLTLLDTKILVAMTRGTGELEASGARIVNESLTEAIQARRAEWDAPERVAFASDWRTDTVLALARQMDGSGDFGAMPILADALQDAGCGDDNILGHCRGPGPHVRGCWVVDLVLGKE